MTECVSGQAWCVISSYLELTCHLNRKYHPKSCIAALDLSMSLKTSLGCKMVSQKYTCLYIHFLYLEIGEAENRADTKMGLCTVH